MRVAPLKGKGGAVLSADHVNVLYARPNIDYYYAMPTWFDALQTTPITNIAIDEKTQVAMQSLILRIQIPKDAAPGDYQGAMTISAQGAAPVRIPIHLRVADWTIPDPRDFTTYIGIYQSPTSVSMQYNVPMWSDAHWALLAKSFAMLGRAGNKMVNIPVVDKTQMGNDDGFITWVKKPDGSYDLDFSIFDRYMELVTKHCGPQDHVALQIWHASGWRARPVDQENTVTVLDPKTGERSHMQVPNFDSPEARKFWKPVLDGIQSRLTKMGMPNAMCIGILSDSTAPSSVFTMFDEIMPPKAKWHRGNHTQNYSPKPYPADKGGGLVVLHEYCYGLRMADPDEELPPFWNLRGSKPATAYDRISNHERYMSLSWYRNAAALSLFRQTQGVGRVCLDYWPALKVGKDKKWIYNRFPQSTCNQRRPSLQKMSWPGPDGAETTIRYETFLEGIQDAEAVVAISRAIDQDEARLGPALVKECREALADNLRYQVFARDVAPRRPYHYGWQELSARLYACAAKVQKKK